MVEGKKEIKKGFPLQTTPQSNAYKQQVQVKKAFHIEIR
jgi:hypothetical protein